MAVSLLGNRNKTSKVLLVYHHRRLPDKSACQLTHRLHFVPTLNAAIVAITISLYRHCHRHLAGRCKRIKENVKWDFVVMPLNLSIFRVASRQQNIPQQQCTAPHHSSSTKRELTTVRAQPRPAAVRVLI